MNNLTVQSGAVLTHAANGSAQTSILNLTLTGNLQIDAGAAINLDGKGFSSRKRPGRGAGASGCTGAGYGGRGGSNPSSAGGTYYGNPLNPVDIGSGACGWSGTGGAGGGLAKITVAGTLTLNGTITANGTAGTGNSGGGSGGGINIVTATVAGSTGMIRANGGGYRPPAWAARAEEGGSSSSTRPTPTRAGSARFR